MAKETDRERMMRIIELALDAALCESVITEDEANDATAWVLAAAERTPWADE